VLAGRSGLEVQLAARRAGAPEVDRRGQGQAAVFKRPVGPGDQLVEEAAVIKVARGIWKYAAKGTVDGQLVVEGELMCTMRTTDELAEK